MLGLALGASLARCETRAHCFLLVFLIALKLYRIRISSIFVRSKLPHCCDFERFSSLRLEALC